MESYNLNSSVLLLVFFIFGVELLDAIPDVTTKTRASLSVPRIF